MMLITKEQRAKLLKNALVEADHKPVVKLFTPWGSATWLFTKMGEDEDMLFGLCDLGQGFPELGYNSLEEIRSIRGPFRLQVERDLYFVATMPLTQYVEKANARGRIVEA